MIYPWQAPLWQRLTHLHALAHFPHALLFKGTEGMGKVDFAQHLAHSLLCMTPLDSPLRQNGSACHACQACHLLETGYHPDLRTVTLEDKRHNIKIDQIRALQSYAALTPQYRQRRVILIYPAETMNHQAANSLLKLLEEPPESTILILVSHRASELLPTLRSRCQHYDFNQADQHLSEAWLIEHLAPDAPPAHLLLMLSKQAPLAAKQLSMQWDGREAVWLMWLNLLQQKIDPVSCAEAWLKQDAQQTLDWLISWAQDLLCCQLSDITHLRNADKQEILMQYAQTLDIRRLFGILDALLIGRRALLSQSHIRPQTILEEVALNWLQIHDK